MNLNVYNNEIKEMINQVLELRSQHSDVVKKSCKKLIEYGKSEADGQLLGFAYYYLAESYFYDNKYDKFIKNLILGLEYQQETFADVLLARSYNMLGINSDNQGNIPAAIDYYLISLKYSRESGLNYEAGLANTNIGQINMSLHDYKTAIQYLEKALSFFHLTKEEPNSMRNSAIVEISIGLCHYRIGDMKSALQYFYKIEKERDKYLYEPHYQVIFMIFEATFRQALGEYERRDFLINQLITLVGEIHSILDIYDEAFMLCELLREAKRYEDLWMILERIDLLSKQAGITNMQLRVLRYKIAYYKELSNEAGYLQACADYYLLSEQLETENKTIAKKSIELRMDLERIKERQQVIQEENKILQEKSERDSLTRLPNREKLNSYSEELFERAYQNQTKIAFEILDIDNFKHYNDTYGHQAGDRCLRKVAQLLHNLMEQGIFCARYGGDEFIILYENMSDEEILKVTRKLKQDVVALKLEHKNSTVSPVVTISQGICNAVPIKSNRIWDFFYAADMALYRVKRTSRNDIGIVNGKPD